tara:strand:+ start:314 stop:646 length:333 start_codon:yes stop_codon:yes gene_type:complete
MSYIDRLPEDVINVIYSFVSYKRKRPLYLDEYEEMIVDSYNKWCVKDERVYRYYKDIYVKDDELYFLYQGFKMYMKNIKYFYMLFCPYVGQFKTIASRKHKKKEKLIKYV